MANIDTTGKPQEPAPGPAALRHRRRARHRRAAIRSIHATVRRLGAALVRAQPRTGARSRCTSSSAATRASRATGSKPSSRTARRARARSVTSAGVVPTPAVAYLTRTARLRRGRGDLGLAQPVRGQRHQGVLRQGREVHRARRARGRGDRRRPVVDARGRRRRRRCRTPTWSARTSITCARCFPKRRRSAGFKLAIDCANGATTPVAPELFSSLGLETDRHRQSARRPQHQPELRIDASRAAGADGRRAADAGWASRSTATATARSSSIIAGRSSTATPCC